MTFAYFFLFYLFLVFIILDMEDCVSVISHQLIHLPFSLLVILVTSNVYASIKNPLLALSVESPLFVYLPWILLPSWDISICLQRVYMLFAVIRQEETKVTAICWSPILHLAKWMSQFISTYASKRWVVNLTMIEHTYSSEWFTCIIRICVLYHSQSVRHSVPQSADQKDYFNIIHLLNWCVFMVLFKWMNDFMLKILLKLPVILLEGI